MNHIEAQRLRLLPLSSLTEDFLRYGFFQLNCQGQLGADGDETPPTHLDSPKPASLDWEGRPIDLGLFRQLTTLLWDVASKMPVNRQQLTKNNLQSIQDLLVQSPLFTAMKSGHIVVSSRHRGTTPFLHTLNTCQKLQFSLDMSATERFLVLLAAVMHDTGKAMAVGAAQTVDDILALMWWHSIPFEDKDNRNKRHTDSYRNHQLISAQILRELLGQFVAEEERASNVGFTCACDQSKLLELVIELHHFHADLFRILDSDTRAQRIADCVNVIQKSLPAVQWQQFMRIFACLCRADLLSVSHKNNKEWLKFEKNTNLLFSQLLSRPVSAD